MKKIFLSFVLFAMAVFAASAQFGIKAGVNMANQIRSFDSQAFSEAFRTSNFTGYQFGLIYQSMPQASGVGCGTGLMITQKGSAYRMSSLDGYDASSGYLQYTYLEVPMNVRGRIYAGGFGVYGTVGLYGGYALSAKLVNEDANTSTDQDFATQNERLDFGYTFGVGVEVFDRLQLGALWEYGLRNMHATKSVLPVSQKTNNKVFSITLAYLF